MIGSDGINIIDFNNVAVVEDISTIALAFIMFYGGFGINMKMIKSSLRITCSFIIWNEWT